KSDGRRIQQVLINYLTNACKNTREGEIHLHCSVTENPGKVTLSVADTGPGVPKEKADMIFNRFTKLNEFVQGSGLGLNICQTIANKLQGEVYLDTLYTNGARFVFVISQS
ncbi:MAG: HAMP domain-containing histidine kinase, partial [Bacteroidales bacterium]|nr:HAMP domain-containing histidine kinase [Bacteroidales bacterium]